MDLDLLNNPIAERELALAFHRRGALVRLLLFAAAAGAVVYVVWPREVKLLIHRDLISQWTLNALSTALRTLVLLIGPSYAALSVTRDREQGTLDMLCATPGGARALFYGKFMASTAFLWTLVAATMPAAAAVYALGGVEAWRLAAIYLEMFLWSAAICAIGVTCSVRVERSPGALAQAYGYVLPAGLLWLLFPNFHLLWIAAPAAVLPAILRHSATLRILVYPADLALVDESGFSKSFGAAGAKAWALLLLIPPRLRRPMWDWMNPVLTRELHWERLGGALWFQRVLPPALAAGLGGAVWLIGMEGQPALWFLLASGIALMITPAMGASAISREHDHGTFDSMAVTTMRPYSILWPKIYVAFRAAMTVFAVMAVVAIPYIAWRTPAEFGVVPGAVAVVVCAAVFLATASVFCSLASRSTAQALTNAYCAALTLFAGAPLACHVFRVFSDVPVESYGWIALFSPAAPLLALAKTKGLSDVAALYGASDLVPMYCGLSLSLSAGLFAAMAAGFDWFWKRGPLRRR